VLSTTSRFRLGGKKKESRKLADLKPIKKGLVSFLLVIFSIDCLPSAT